MASAKILNWISVLILVCIHKIISSDAVPIDSFPGGENLSANPSISTKDINPKSLNKAATPDLIIAIATTVKPDKNNDQIFTPNKPPDAGKPLTRLVNKIDTESNFSNQTIGTPRSDNLSINATSGEDEQDDPPSLKLTGQQKESQVQSQLNINKNDQLRVTPPSVIVNPSLKAEVNISKPKELQQADKGRSFGRPLKSETIDNAGQDTVKKIVPLTSKEIQEVVKQKMKNWQDVKSETKEKLGPYNNSTMTRSLNNNERSTSGNGRGGRRRHHSASLYEDPCKLDKHDTNLLANIGNIPACISATLKKISKSYAFIKAR